ncbi:MAG: UDP-3-O-(3-hydroxymyristoyl)glucosamine N-acyltransferase [Gammaproteobacteria bacterium]|nr:UDP-3-O-(3-hydroxymyristoyl)glucosamine N-acyltransferase [Gammaproteobacteria bacterium]
MRMLRGASLGELAALVKGQLRGDAERKILGIATLEKANSEQISFLSNRKYQKFLKQTQAGAVIVAPELADECPVDALICDNPYLAYARIATYMSGQAPQLGVIHPTAIIAESANVSADVNIGPYVVIGERSVITSGVSIGAGSVIGNDCIIGEGTRLFANVTFYDDVVTGKECIFHSACVIGADGFGIAKDGERWVKIPQIGGVRIGNCVEIGASTTVDCGALEPTVLEDGVKLDDQIHVAHNCYIGENTVAAAETGISGSTRIGKNCTLGGGSGFNGHITIADNVHFTGMSMVTKSITEPGVYSSGIPVQDNRSWRKNTVKLRQIEQLEQKIKNLEAQIAKTDTGD